MNQETLCYQDAMYKEAAELFKELNRRIKKQNQESQQVREIIFDLVITGLSCYAFHIIVKKYVNRDKKPDTNLTFDTQGKNAEPNLHKK